MLAWLCLGQGTDLYMAQLMPLPLTSSSKSSLVLPSLFYLSGACSPGNTHTTKHQLDHSTSPQTDNHASTSPLSFLQAGCLFCCPTDSIKGLNA